MHEKHGGLGYVCCRGRTSTRGKSTAATNAGGGINHVKVVDSAHTAAAGDKEEFATIPVLPLGNDVAFDVASPTISLEGIQVIEPRGNFSSNTNSTSSSPYFGTDRQCIVPGVRESLNEEPHAWHPKHPHLLSSTRLSSICSSWARDHPQYSKVLLTTRASMSRIPYRKSKILIPT